MNRQARWTLLIVLLTTFLTGLAVPGWAGDVTVDAVIAAQYPFGFFIALVYAHGTDELLDVQLVANDLPIVPDKVEAFSVDYANNATLWKIVKFAKDVVKPGDTLTAVVTDVQGGTGLGTAACGSGQAGWWRITVCR